MSPLNRKWVQYASLALGLSLALTFGIGFILSQSDIAKANQPDVTLTSPAPIDINSTTPITVYFKYGNPTGDLDVVNAVGRLTANNSNFEVVGVTDYYNGSPTRGDDEPPAQTVNPTACQQGQVSGIPSYTVTPTLISTGYGLQSSRTGALGGASTETLREKATGCIEVQLRVSSSAQPGTSTTLVFDEDALNSNSYQEIRRPGNQIIVLTLTGEIQATTGTTNPITSSTTGTTSSPTTTTGTTSTGSTTSNPTTGTTSTPTTTSTTGEPTTSTGSTTGEPTTTTGTPTTTTGTTSNPTTTGSTTSTTSTTSEPTTTGSTSTGSTTSEPTTTGTTSTGSTTSQPTTTGSTTSTTSTTSTPITTGTTSNATTSTTGTTSTSSTTTSTTTSGPASTTSTTSQPTTTSSTSTGSPVPVTTSTPFTPITTTSNTSTPTATTATTAQTQLPRSGGAEILTGLSLVLAIIGGFLFYKSRQSRLNDSNVDITNN